MKTGLTIAVFSLLTLPFSQVVQAQAPQLTAANTVPVAGMTITSFSTNTFNPGGAGAAQTWDFSTQNYTANSSPTYGTCSSPGARCTRFSNPDLVDLRTNLYDSFANYYNVSSAVFSYLGKTQSPKIPTGQSPLTYIYDKPRDVLRFPMSYNTTFTNSWYARGTVPYRKEVTTGVDTVEADAWGTIKTPAGTFQALRVRTSCTIYDTVVLSPTTGPGGDTSITQFVNYTWYDGISKLPIYSGTINSTNSRQRFFPDIGIINNFVGATYYKETPAGVTPLNHSGLSWKITPNPATGGQVQVQLENKNSTQIALYLTDLLGREVRTLQTKNYSSAAGLLMLQTAGLPAGTYILSVVAGSIPQGAQRITLAE